MPDFSRHAEIAAALRTRGMTETEVGKVTAGNWLRVFTEVRA
jgi:microsomal dipeptidase-like Zn-dependent dipeptidase